jgi:hypothetical protein
MEAASVIYIVLPLFIPDWSRIETRIGSVGQQKRQAA